MDSRQRTAVPNQSLEDSRLGVTLHLREGESVTTPNDQAGGHTFTPRVGALPTSAPFNPGNYFLVAFFGGVIALMVVSVMNLPRLTTVGRLQARTHMAVAATGVARQ